MYCYVRTEYIWNKYSAIFFQQIHEVDSEELKACEQLVHDQHLQQQGWAAVVANLEDITRYVNNL